MTTDEPGPRPRQVTIGGWLAAVASAVLVVSVFDTMTQLHSIDTRDRLTKALTGWPTDLGISLDDALSLTRGALFVTAVAAVVTGILGVFVLQRHATARIVLTVAAVPVVLTAPVSGGFLSLLIGGAAVMLWTREARDWFAGRAPATRPDERQPAPSPRPMPSRVETPADRAAWAPPAYPTPAAPRPSPVSVPSEVRIACLLTWIFSAMTGGLSLLAILAVALDRNGILGQLRDKPEVRNTSLSDAELVGTLVAGSAVVIAWCILAALFAVLTWRRQRAGRVLLMVAAGTASVGALFGLPYSLLHVAACATTFVLLLRPAARSWFGQDRASASPPSPMDAWPPPQPPKQHAGPQERPHERPSGKPPVW